jgi:hypothetical protein|nr:MAG TPA: hypothetical protein [Caudoviricetes sp.]
MKRFIYNSWYFYTKLDGRKDFASYVKFMLYVM